MIEGEKVRTYRLRTRLLSEQDIRDLLQRGGRREGNEVVFEAEAYCNAVLGKHGPSAPPTEEVFFIDQRHMLVSWPGTGKARIMEAEIEPARARLLFHGYHHGCGTEAWDFAQQ